MAPGGAPAGPGESPAGGAAPCCLACKTARMAGGSVASCASLKGAFSAPVELLALAAPGGGKAPSPGASGNSEAGGKSPGPAASRPGGNGGGTLDIPPIVLRGAPKASAPVASDRAGAELLLDEPEFPKMACSAKRAAAPISAERSPAWLGAEAAAGAAPGAAADCPPSGWSLGPRSPATSFPSKDAANEASELCTLPRFFSRSAESFTSGPSGCAGCAGGGGAAAAVRPVGGGAEAPQEPTGNGCGGGAGACGAPP